MHDVIRVEVVFFLAGLFGEALFLLVDIGLPRLCITTTRITSPY